MIPIRDNQPRFSTPYINYFIVALNVVVFLFELMLGAQLQRDLNAFIYQFGVVPLHFSRAIAALPHFNLAGDFLPIVTSMFLHGSFFFIIGDTRVLWIFSPNIEVYL